MATVRSQDGHSEVPGMATVGIQWGYSGERHPDPYHGVAPRDAPCPGTTTPGTHHVPTTEHAPLIAAEHAATTVRQASFGYSHRV